MFKITKIAAFFLFFVLVFLNGSVLMAEVYQVTDIQKAEFCKTQGEVQTKYTAVGCNTTSIQRTCCSSGIWSGWGKECSTGSGCGDDECWNGSTCVAKGVVNRNCKGTVAHATGGTQTRSARCWSAQGWEYGDWTGTCQCEGDYTWDGSKCKAPETVNAFVWKKQNSFQYCNLNGYSRCPKNIMSTIIAGAACTEVGAVGAVCESDDGNCWAEICTAGTNPGTAETAK